MDEDFWILISFVIREVNIYLDLAPHGPRQDSYLVLLRS